VTEFSRYKTNVFVEASGYQGKQLVPRPKQKPINRLKQVVL